jgi:hypothetical protein
MARLSAQTKLYDTLVNLKRHLNSCHYCIPARKSRSPYDMCAQGLNMTLDAAMGYDDIIKLRIAAHNHPAGHIFACPDLSKHGKVYSLTTPALHVTGIQDSLI